MTCSYHVDGRLWHRGTGKGLNSIQAHVRFTALPPRSFIHHTRSVGMRHLLRRRRRELTSTCSFVHTIFPFPDARETVWEGGRMCAKSTTLHRLGTYRIKPSKFKCSIRAELEHESSGDSKSDQISFMTWGRNASKDD